MLRLLLAVAALVAFAAPAAADDRSYVVTNFDRIRVDGPFEVRVVVGGGSAHASASGDAKVIDNIELEVQGSTLIVRKDNRGWGEQGKTDGPAPIVTVAVPALRSATVIGGGKLILAGTLRSARLDLQITGAGSIDAKGIDADDVVVTLIGNGGIALAGKAARARLLSNGNGSIAAGPLIAGDLVVRLDGPGAVQASARFTADVTSTGLGSVAVAGNAKCRVSAPAGGPVSCGAASQ